MAATNPAYVRIADLTASSTGKRRVMEYHLDDNHDVLNLLVEMLTTTLFEQGGVVIQGTFSLSGTTFSIDSLHAGITTNRASAILRGGGTYDVGSEPDGKHRLVLAALPERTDRNYTDPETSELITHPMPTNWGVIAVVRGDASNYPDIGNAAYVPMLKFEMSGGAVSTWSVDTDYIAKLAKRPRVDAGATTDRPSSPPTGFMFFDTDLGKPIWWDGSQWVDATGTAV